ncbi:TetR family transcriptional regulator [Ideonella alba]|uniref:TetR family transcriptional regulator n=1 Tax=Ideonella alba TaxID=2824118 RepID=A0A940YJP2_9BURK|nr:TetR family transcriptional regulator [Ideonella alba]MBQ0931109.1 TetR family transcriptional regulator [Ideonella alba]
MVRKSKADALVTRQQLLDAAEQVFLSQGVAGTSLQQVAAAAGLTRGAIYWHFEDKAALFTAMMDRVTLPCECAFDEARGATPGDPCATLLGMAMAPLRALSGHAQMQRVFRIAMHLTEYTGELAPVGERHRQAVAEFVQAMELPCRALVPDAHGAALGLFGLVDGLMRQWTMDPAAFDLVAVGERAVRAYVGGLAARAATASPPAAPAGSPRKSRAQPARST